MACIRQKQALRESPTGQTDQNDSHPRLPVEPMLNRLGCAHPILAKIASPHGRQRDCGRSRHAANPDHHGKNM
jgi:hypothetical protein